eukprot:499270-Hanusia_phi.AAC.1
MGPQDDPVAPPPPPPPLSSSSSSLLLLLSPPPPLSSSLLLIFSQADFGYTRGICWSIPSVEKARTTGEENFDNLPSNVCFLLPSACLAMSASSSHDHHHQP